MKPTRLLFLFAALALVARAAYLPYHPVTKHVQDNLTVPAGRTFAINGTLNGTPAGGTLDLSAVTVILAAGTGADGKLLTGAGAPSDGTGINGDAYLRTNGAFYVKAAGTWGSPVATLAPLATTLAGYGITNGVATDGTYADPSWLTSLAKSKVGLGNADNTSDANKPISTATQTALDLKETPAGAQAKADTAESDAIAAAATDATTKANAAQAAAIAAAATDATTKANQAFIDAETLVTALEAVVATKAANPSVAALPSDALTLAHDAVRRTVTVSATKNFTLASAGSTGDYLLMELTVAGGPHTVTTNFDVIRNGAASAANVGISLPNGRHWVNLFNMGDGTPRWEDTKAPLASETAIVDSAGNYPNDNLEDALAYVAGRARAQTIQGAFDGLGSVLESGAVCAAKPVTNSANITSVTLSADVSGSVTVTFRKYTPTAGALGSPTTLGTATLTSEQDKITTGLTWSVSDGDRIDAVIGGTISTLKRLSWTLKQ